MRKSLLFLSLCFLILTLGCSKSEEADINNPNSTNGNSEIPDDVERVDYILSSTNNSGVTGIASFIPNDDGTTTVYIDLENATQSIHPATINYGSTEEGGSIAIELKECECEISETVVTQLGDGTPISFVELLTFSGHLNIYESPTNGTIIAQVNIGSNAF